MPTWKAWACSRKNIIYSDYTTPELYRAGASRGAIDPCFPAKIGISARLQSDSGKHRKKPLERHLLPDVRRLASPLVKIVGANACPTVTATPETVKAAFTKENDVFTEHSLKYLDPILNFADRKLFAQQMLQAWQPILGLSDEENDRAIEAGYAALTDYETSIRKRARQVLDQLEREDRIGIVMLGRPYHHDPGLNHEILEEFQKLGYPIFSQNTLPLDEDMLERLFGEDVRAGVDQPPARNPPTPGRTPTRAAPTTKYGRRNSRRGIRIWWRSKCRASSAATTRRSME